MIALVMTNDYEELVIVLWRHQRCRNQLMIVGHNASLELPGACSSGKVLIFWGSKMLFPAC